MFATGWPLIWVPPVVIRKAITSTARMTVKTPPTTSGMMGNSSPGLDAVRFWLGRFFVLVRFGKLPSARHKIQRSFLVPPAACARQAWIRAHGAEKALRMDYAILYLVLP